VPLPAAQTRHIAGDQLGQPDGGPRPSPTCASGPSIRRGCGVGRSNTGVRLAANTERTGALKTGTAHFARTRARRVPGAADGLHPPVA
jgi:hypothetical protein